MTTKKAFLTAYRQLLPQRQTWATDPEKLDRFMSTVSASIGASPPALPGRNWSAAGQDTARDAFRKAGCKGPFTMKALRELPHG